MEGEREDRKERKAKREKGRRKREEGRLLSKTMFADDHVCHNMWW